MISLSCLTPGRGISDQKEIAQFSDFVWQISFKFNIEEENYGTK